MPSDTPLQSVDETPSHLLEVFSGSISRFRSAVAGTIRQVRTTLDAANNGADGWEGSSRGALGNFAAGRIDAQRFDSLLAVGEPPPTTNTAALGGILARLEDIVARLNDLCVLEVNDDVSLRDAVDRRLCEIGAAFGAARALEKCCSTGLTSEEANELTTAFPHRRWSRRERELAPPLVVSVSSGKAAAETLGEFLDGNQKLLLNLDTASAPAPLARLISPTRFVQQTTDTEALARFAEYEGPGIAALVTDDAAQFRHDPEAGDHYRERITIDSVPDINVCRPVGGVSSRQQIDALRHLLALTAAARPGIEPEAESEAVEKLAAWLLQHTDLSNLEE